MYCCLFARSSDKKREETCEPWSCVLGHDLGFCAAGGSPTTHKELCRSVDQQRNSKNLQTMSLWYPESFTSEERQWCTAISLISWPHVIPYVNFSSKWKLHFIAKPKLGQDCLSCVTLSIPCLSLWQLYGKWSNL